MQMINTPDGITSIADDRDIIELVEKYISDEAADYLAEKLSAIDEEQMYAEQEFNSDFRAIEGENEYYHNILQDVSDGLKQIMDYLDNVQRMNRDKVFIMAERLNDKITTNL